MTTFALATTGGEVSRLISRSLKKFSEKAGEGECPLSVGHLLPCGAFVVHWMLLAGTRSGRKTVQHISE